MTGKSRKMLKLFKDIGRVAAKDVSVLITGESGTGKELVAREIHASSARKSGPFAAINAASIPRELIESELFGWKKGAFSGAVETRAGCIAMAEGGTLLLDEISEMDLKLQAKILRFLQEMEYTPLGGSESVRADVRILCATNRKLREETAKGTFREDLFYRLNVIEIKLPPLREREGDVLELAARFLDNALNKYEIGHKEFSEKTRRFMLEYRWPGNVRELENAVKRAAILSESSVIEIKDLVLAEPAMYSIRDFLDEKLSRYIKEMTEHGDGTLYDSIIGEVEKALIAIVMKETNGNQLKAAKTLGINRNTLRAKIKLHGL
jgi:DNA-binding NtrC family response regulator